MLLRNKWISFREDTPYQPWMFDDVSKQVSK